METTFDSNDPFQPAQPARPQFLTVICILSFVGCALMFIIGIYGILTRTPEKMQESIEQIRQFKPEMADHFEQQMIEMQENPYMRVSQYLSLLYILLSFLGVLMMWKLNRNGFFLYLAGELLFYVGFFVAAKPMMSAMDGGGMMPGLGPIMVGLIAIFDLVFIIMYAVNLKHMK
ncbi:MAG: hypothetical protein ACXVPQ_05230 [Bacteroidia bacterium]